VNRLLAAWVAFVALFALIAVMVAGVIAVPLATFYLTQSPVWTVVVGVPFAVCWFALAYALVEVVPSRWPS